MNNSINYNHVRYFFEVARQGSITAAAKSLRVSQPTISTQLRALEESLGVELFDRSGRGLVLTRRGEMAAAFAGEMVRSATEMQIALDEDANAPTQLRVGVGDSLPKWVVSWLLEPVLAIRPRVRLVVRERPTDELFGAIARQELDLGFTDQAPRRGAGLHSQRVISSPVVLYATESLVETVRASLRGGGPPCPLVLPGEDSFLRLQIEAWFSRHGVPLDVVAEVDDSALGKIVASSGAACFAAPRLIADALAKHFDLIDAGELSGLTEDVFAVRPRRIRPHALAAKIVAGAADRLDG